MTPPIPPGAKGEAVQDDRQRVRLEVYSFFFVASGGMVGALALFAATDEAHKTNALLIAGVNLLLAIWLQLRANAVRSRHGLERLGP